MLTPPLPKTSRPSIQIVLLPLGEGSSGFPRRYRLFLSIQRPSEGPSNHNIMYFSIGPEGLLIFQLKLNPPCPLFLHKSAVSINLIDKINLIYTSPVTIYRICEISPSPPLWREKICFHTTPVNRHYTLFIKRLLHQRKTGFSDDPINQSSIYT